MLYQYNTSAGEWMQPRSFYFDAYDRDEEEWEEAEVIETVIDPQPENMDNEKQEARASGTKEGTDSEATEGIQEKEESILKNDKGEDVISTGAGANPDDYDDELG